MDRPALVAIAELSRRGVIREAQAAQPLPQDRSQGQGQDDARFAQEHPRAAAGSAQGGRFVKKNSGSSPTAKAASTGKARTGPRPQKLTARAAQVWNERLVRADVNADLVTQHQFANITGLRTREQQNHFRYTQSLIKLQRNLGSSLQIEHPENADVRREIADLGAVPATVLRQLRVNGVRVAIGTRSPDSYPEAQALTQRTWDGRDFSTVGADYVPGNPGLPNGGNMVIVNAAHVQRFTALHELGHAYDLSVAHISSDPRLAAIQMTDGSKLGDRYYFDPSTPQTLASSRLEFVAETLKNTWLGSRISPAITAYYKRFPWDTPPPPFKGHAARH